MIHAFIRLFLFATVLVVPLGSKAAEDGKLWVFEGLITGADPALAPDLQSGWVLAGSFFFAPMELEEEPVRSSPRSGRLAGGIHDGELTVDLYYQLHFEAFQADGLAGLDYQDDDPDADGRDLIGWFIPMRGRLKESQWTSRWLQIWLADSEGKMIRSLPPRFSPYGIDWKTGWFRMTFRNDAGESAFVDGRIEVFAPEDQMPAVDEESRWHGIAIELSELLKQRDLAVAGLQEQLEKARSRMEGLQQMVDLMVEERAHLQEENARLAEQAQLADPAIRETVAELTTEKAFLEEEISSLRRESEGLELRLVESERDRALLQDRISELEEEVAMRTVAVPQPAAPVSQPVVEPVKPTPKVETKPVKAPAPEAVKDEESDRERAWRRGPRKFR